MNVFISHSTKDKAIASKLSSFLESLSNSIEVFYSSDEGAIPTGSNYMDKIASQLKTCDAFLPLLSENYFKSKFCMIELGFAYSQLISLDDEQKHQYIYPFCIPPLARNALSGTPLGHIEAARIDDAEGYRAILEKNQDFQSGQNKRIRAFTDDIHALLLSEADAFSRSVIDVFCADNVNMNDEHDFVSFSAMDRETTLNFNLDPYDTAAQRPNYIGLVYRFVDKMDLAQYLDLNENSSLRFEIDSFTNSLSKIDVEFKFSENKNILKRYCLSINPGKNAFSIPLNDMRSKALHDISEICFVIHPGYTVEKEGMIKICNLEVVMNA